MQRRTFLGTLAAATLPVAAGCIDGGGAEPADGGTPSKTSSRSPTPTDALDGGDPQSPTGTDSPTETDPPAGEIGFGIEETTLQRGLVVPNTPDSIAVEHTDRSFLWMTLSVEHSPPERTAFRIEVPPKTYTALAPDEYRTYRTLRDDVRYYDGSTGTALLLFELPYRVDGDNVAYRLPSGGGRTGGGVFDRLGREPPPMRATLEKRYDETPGEPVAVEATNEGDVPGRFLGAVNREGGGAAYAPIGRVSVLLGPGETRTVPVADPPMGEGTPTPGGHEGPDATYHLDWATGEDAVTLGQ